MRYIQVNGPVIQNWLAFDIDRENAGYDWEDAGLPAPNIITLSPKTRRCHYLYALDVPVNTGPSGRRGPIAFAAAVHRAMSATLDADAGYAGLLTKNPLHGHWMVHSLHARTYLLDELAGSVDMRAANTNLRPQEDRSYIGRNVALFDWLRKWAYRARERHQSYSGWFEAVQRQAQAMNDFDNPLQEREVRAISRSVAKWVWYRYTGTSNVQRGIMALPSDMELSERQRLSAHRTNGVRTARTDSRLQNSLERTVKVAAAAGAAPSVTSIAAAAGVARDRVYERAAQLALKSGRQQQADRRAEARRLRDLEKSWLEVGEALGISAEAARKLASRA